MIYSYSPIAGPADPNLAIYPLLPINLIYKHQLIKYPISALVDSGAEYCYCLKTIGEYLRINFRNKKPITSRAANGTEFIGFKEIVGVIINGTKIESPFIFSDSINPSFPIILGQNSFFSQFKICFEKSKNQFSIDPV